MKRSGGRRYYRPDDVDLLKGIRRLLYGEGYTIRGVQRILKEHGIKAVQGLADSTVAASFGAVEKTLEHTMAEDDGDAPASFAGDDEDYEGGDDGIDFRFLELDEDGIAKNLPETAATPSRSLDRARLEGVLQDLMAARQLLDSALREG
jgi:DNA-binding transcriptional MerR regulator